MEENALNPHFDALIQKAYVEVKIHESPFSSHGVMAAINTFSINSDQAERAIQIALISRLYLNARGKISFQPSSQLLSATEYFFLNHRVTIIELLILGLLD